VSEKRKQRDTLKFPVLRAQEKQVGLERKLSEIIKEIALRLLRKPDAVPSMPAAETALLLATAAWNLASGEPDLRIQHREMFKRFDRGGPSPWPELLSSDTDRLMVELVDYKQAHYASDRRLIVAVGMSSEGKVQVHWAEDDKLIPRRSTPGPRTPRPPEPRAATRSRKSWSRG